MNEDIRKIIDKIKNLKQSVNENISKLTPEQLNIEFKKLNKQYIKVEKEMDKIARTHDTWVLEQKLDKIQMKMSEISAELEKRGF